MPLWISCEMRGWESDLFLDVDRVAFQTSIRLEIAASQKDYYWDESERRQTPAPRCLQWKTSGSCHEHLSRVGQFCRACNFSKPPLRQPLSPSLSSLNRLINLAKFTSRKVLLTWAMSPRSLTPDSQKQPWVRCCRGPLRAMRQVPLSPERQTDSSTSDKQQPKEATGAGKPAFNLKTLQEGADLGGLMCFWVSCPLFWWQSYCLTGAFMSRCTWISEKPLSVIHFLSEVLINIKHYFFCYELFRQFDCFDCYLFWLKQTIFSAFRRPL